VRLNKFISETGVCSRREADKWIEAGRVTLNGLPAQLGTKVGESDEVRVDGELVGAKKTPIYIALNKPVGITSTTESQVEENIIDLIGHRERIFPIGRLDKDSEGLILLTNNGDIVNEILRSENEHEKEYIVSVNRPITDLALGMLAGGAQSPDPSDVFRARIPRAATAAGAHHQHRSGDAAHGRVAPPHRRRSRGPPLGLTSTRPGQFARSAAADKPSDHCLPAVARQSGSCAREASQRKKSSPLLVQYE